MKALIVVDMQNDFINGSLGTKEAEAIVPKVVEKINNWDGVLFFTKDTHCEDYLDTLEGKKLPVKHCIRGTYGWELHKELIKFKGSWIEKRTFGYEWGHLLDRYDEFELCGLCTDICVVSNALILRALYPNRKITVDASCCAGVTPEKHKAALEVMKSCQIDVINE